MVVEYKHRVMEGVEEEEEEAADEGAAVAKTKTMAIDKSRKLIRHLADSAQEFNNVAVEVVVEEVVKAEGEEEAALGASPKQQLNNNPKINKGSSLVQTPNLNLILILSNLQLWEMHLLLVGLVQVLIPITKETPPILDVSDLINNAREHNHQLEHLVLVLAGDLRERARVALAFNRVKILQAVPKCRPAPSDNLHLQVPITLEELQVVLTRTDTSMQHLLKHKVII